MTVAQKVYEVLSWPYIDYKPEHNGGKLPDELILLGRYAAGKALSPAEKRAAEETLKKLLKRSDIWRDHSSQYFHDPGKVLVFGRTGKPKK